MDESVNYFSEPEVSDKVSDVVYSTDKDFYRGISGELRYKAEGLFKKAKEKGISVEEISIITLKENTIDFPGIGVTVLPTFIVKVKGRHIASGQIIIDAKQIDYYNRYQKYLSDKIEGKNVLKDERGKVIRENGKRKVKSNPEFILTDWEKFEVGKSLVDDKEYGMEKTITGACDRVIRKLMGENDWLNIEEARLLDEEFNEIQNKILKEQENKKTTTAVQIKKATERQINFLKSRIKNLGLDPEDNTVIKEFLKQAGFEENMNIAEMNTGEMSKLIDGVVGILPKVKEGLIKKNYLREFKQGGTNTGEIFKQ